MPSMIQGEIIITTTGIRITPYKKGQSYYLEKSTSVRNYPYNNRNPVTGFLIPMGDEKNKGTFVTHLHDPNYIQEMFPNYIVKNEKPSEYKQLNYELAINDDVEPREVQYQIIQGIIDTEKKDQWFVYLSQGLGKTLLTVYMIPYFNTKTLIMCYNKTVLNQWLKTIEEKTNIRDKSVLMIDDSLLLHKIEAGEFPAWEYDVFTCTPSLLDKFGKKYGYNKLSNLMKRMGIGFKVFDEAHRNIKNIIKINAFTSVKRTLYLSGDFAQSDKIKEQLYYRIFHGVPVLTPTEELMSTLKFTTAVVVMFNSHPTELEKTSVYSRRGFSFYEYMKYELKKMQDSKLFEVLCFTLDTISKTNTKGYKILILVNLIDHVDLLKDLLEEKYGKRYNVCRFHSQTPDSEKDYCLEYGDMIVSTYQSFSVGIDVSLIKYVISCSICTKIDDNQASGRSRPLPDGSDAFYFMLSDLGFPYTKKKLSGRLGYLQETKIKKIERITYPD